MHDRRPSRESDDRNVFELREKYGITVRRDRSDEGVAPRRVQIYITPAARYRRGKQLILPRDLTVSYDSPPSHPLSTTAQITGAADGAFEVVA